LVLAAQEGDRLAFDALIGPLIEPAYRLAFGMLHQREEAEDAVQEAAVKAWRKLGNLRPGANLRPWFLGIVANQCRTTRRSRWWSVIKLAHLQVAAPSGGMLPFVGEDLRQALRRLEPGQRAAVILRFYLDLPLEEVAAVLSIPIGTAKSRLSRGIRRLRPLVEDREARPDG